MDKPVLDKYTLISGYVMEGDELASSIIGSGKQSKYSIQSIKPVGSNNYLLLDSSNDRIKLMLSNCSGCLHREDCTHFSPGSKCSFECNIFDSIMGLSGKYVTDCDLIQVSLLESVAMMLVHKFRAERSVSAIGMDYEEVIAVTREGDIIRNRRAHPLLKHITDVNKTLNAFSKSIIASPETVKRLSNDNQKVDDILTISNILKNAHQLRVNKNIGDNLIVDKSKI